MFTARLSVSWYERKYGGTATFLKLRIDRFNSLLMAPRTGSAGACCASKVGDVAMNSRHNERRTLRSFLTIFSLMCLSRNWSRWGGWLQRYWVERTVYVFY